MSGALLARQVREVRDSPALEWVTISDCDVKGMAVQQVGVSVVSRLTDLISYDLVFEE